MLQNMEERATVVLTDKREIQAAFFEGISAEAISSMMITPVIAHGDVMGGIILFATDNKTTLSDTEKKLSQAAATVLGRQLEQ
jgi:LytS/YehU family sensor histidine kinase